MTVTLHLKPELEAGLQAQAQASGMVLEDYLLSLVEGAARVQNAVASPTEQDTRREAVRKMLEFGDKHHLSFGEPVTRNLLHEGHRF